MSFTKVDEREKQAALEEEQARLKALKVGVLFGGQKNPKHTLNKHGCSFFVACIFDLDFFTYSGTKA